MLLALAGALALVIVLGFFLFGVLWPRLTEVVAPGAPPRAEANSESDVHVVIDLPGGPIGVAWNGEEFVIGNRDKPWGFLRLTPSGPDGFEVAKVPVTEPNYRQQVGFAAVTWNGTQYVGYTTGDWFQSPHQNVFTLHDPESLEIIRFQPAPELLGGITWDGAGYWAATRRNTEDANEEAFLYRLDESFEVIDKVPPPGVGCQGLAWDGTHLWFADVFSDSIFVLDTLSNPPRLVRSYETPISYLSGIGFDGRNIWVADYGDNRIQRLTSGLRQAWLEGAATAEDEVFVPAAAAAAPSPSAEYDTNVDELRLKLRSDDWAERMQAEIEMKERGLPIDHDREQNSFPSERTPDSTAVDDWSIELEDTTLYASWHAYFGEDLFLSNRDESGGVISLPLFAKFTITVEGGSLIEPVEREFEAQPGENIQSGVELVSGLGPGTYQASFFIHVQYVDRQGQARILNHSAMTLEVEAR